MTLSKLGDKIFWGAFLRNPFQLHASTLLRPEILRPVINGGRNRRITERPHREAVGWARGNNCPFDPIYNFTTGARGAAGVKTKTICTRPKPFSSSLLDLSEKDVENPGICQKVSGRRGSGKSRRRESSPARVTSKHSLHVSRCPGFAWAPSLIVQPIHLPPYYSGWLANMQHHSLAWLLLEAPSSSYSSSPSYAAPSDKQPRLWLLLYAALLLPPKARPLPPPSPS